MTVVFRGPLNLYNLTVYQPSVNASSATWKQVSSWTANGEPNNLVFMNNDGGGQSGDWSSASICPGFCALVLTRGVVCAGASQSYANGTWTGSASTPNEQIASGYLNEDNEMVRSLSSCHSSSGTHAWNRTS